MIWSLSQRSNDLDIRSKRTLITDDSNSSLDAKIYDISIMVIVRTVIIFLLYNDREEEVYKKKVIR